MDEDADALGRLRRQKAAAEFTRLASQAAHRAKGSEPSDEEIVQAVKRTRKALHLERYRAIRDRGWEDVVIEPESEPEDT